MSCWTTKLSSVPLVERHPLREPGFIDFKAQYQPLLDGGFTGHVATEPVLEPLTPRKPPTDDIDRTAPHVEIVRSAERWRRFAMRKVQGYPARKCLRR
jgi:hypothetical protein